MKKFNLVFGILSGALVLSACDPSSPQGLLDQVRTALQTSNTQLYVQSLTGEALKRCGDLSGMMSLQGEMKAFTDITVGNPVLVWIDQDHEHRDIKRLYTTEIKGTGPDLRYDMSWSLTIRCEINPHVRTDCKIAEILGASC